MINYSSSQIPLPNAECIVLVLWRILILEGEWENGMHKLNTSNNPRASQKREDKKRKQWRKDSVCFLLQVCRVQEQEPRKGTWPKLGFPSSSHQLRWKGSIMTHRHYLINNCSHFSIQHERFTTNEMTKGGLVDHSKTFSIKKKPRKSKRLSVCWAGRRPLKPALLAFHQAWTRSLFETTVMAFDLKIGTFPVLSPWILDLDRRNGMAWEGTNKEVPDLSSSLLSPCHSLGCWTRVPFAPFPR